MEVRFLGHACFELSDGDTRVLIDPFLTGNPKAAIAADDVNPTRSCSPTATATTSATPSRSPSAPARRWSRSSSSPARSARRASRCSTRTSAARSSSTGAGSGSSRRGTPRRRRRAPSTPRPGWWSRSAGPIVYHLGDTCLFSDLQLVGKRTPIDIALMCIGGHYTMDRTDAVEAAQLVGAKTVIPCHYDTFPPIETDAAGVQVRRRVGDQLERGRPRARGDPLGMTHAIVLIEAERSALATLGRRARRHRRRRRGLLGDRRMGLRRDPAPARAGPARAGGHRPDLAAGRGEATQTMVAFEAYSRHDLEALFSVGQ